MGDINVAMLGVGAANVSVERLIVKADVDERKIVMVDSKGILSRNRRDLEKSEPYKWSLCLRTNFEGKDGGIAEALEDADACIAMSRLGPSVIKKEWVKKMNDKPIVFSCPNPIPEIWPYEAKDADAKVVATARSDFPNQLNNSLVFPGIFRGELDVRAKGISDEMCLAAAYEIARMAEEKGLSEEYIVPTMEEWDVYPREAAAAAYQASLEGLARKKTSKQKEYEYAKEIIYNAKRKFEQLKLSCLIPRP